MNVSISLAGGVVGAEFVVWRLAVHYLLSPIEVPRGEIPYTLLAMALFSSVMPLLLLPRDSSGDRDLHHMFLRKALPKVATDLLSSQTLHLVLRDRVR